MMQTMKILEDILSALAFTDACEYAKALDLVAWHRSFSRGSVSL